MKTQYDTIVASDGRKFSFPKGLLTAMPIYNAIYYEYLNTPQDNIVWDNARFKIVQGVRQSGKSRIIKALAVLHAIMVPYKTILVTSFNRSSSNHINDEIRQLYDSLSDPKPKMEVCNQRQIVFENGSTIYTDVANCHSSRGMNVDILLMDEAAFYNENDIKQFWDNNLYIMKMGKREIVIVSSRKNRSKKTNFFWRTWLEAENGSNGFKQFKLSNKHCTTKRNSKWVKEMKSILGRTTYDKEYTIRSK